jgi:hypothetical protein
MTLIPLTLIHLQDDGFHLLVEVVVFNQRFTAVLDTGASKTVFDKTTIEQYANHEHILLSEHLSTGLGTNTMESYTLLLPELKLGELVLNDYKVALLDLSSINKAYEMLELEPVLGVIGGDLLHEYNAVIDYENAILLLNLK